ncbi:MAG: hypothetical protein KGL39_06300 [Patescibacteria group bacterium]|nr:hypothetical protein [Patescibacteria group bacterium]
MTMRIPAESAEAELLRQIELLIAKLAAGEATPHEIQLLQELQKRRVDMMRPRVGDKPQYAEGKRAYA